MRNPSTYRIERKLGEGANGQVYLVTGGSKPERFAMKIGNPGCDLKSEISLLRKISPRIRQGHPLFIEADSYEDQGVERHYYVMAYIEGVSLSAFIEQNGQEWLYLTGYHLLRKLAACHAKGFAFGDLKPSNIMVSEGGRVELIDYGGSAPFGRPIRQFTEVYDREYWDCGTREAGCGYDLFSFAMIYMQLAGAKKPGVDDLRTLPFNRNAGVLLQALHDEPALKPVAPVLAGIIEGRYRDTRKALDDWRARRSAAGLPVIGNGRAFWLKGIIVASALVFVFSLYMTLQ